MEVAEHVLKRPFVGMGIMIFKNGKVLIAKRKGPHAGGVYSFPGGHLEYMEQIEDGLKRETREESGIEINNIKFLCLTNLKIYSPRHYVNLGFTADWVSGEPKNLEPEKSEEWMWCDPDKLPQPLYAMIPNYLEAIKTGKNFFDN